jgi:hypothetical protein
LFTYMIWTLMWFRKKGKCSWHVSVQLILYDTVVS